MEDTGLMLTAGLRKPCNSFWSKLGMLNKVSCSCLCNARKPARTTSLAFTEATTLDLFAYKIFESL